MKRTVILFLIKQLMLFGVLYLALSLNPDRCKNIKIKIKSGDIQTGVLELDPPDDVCVCTGRKVTWTCKSSTNVQSFQIEPKGIVPDDVFEEGNPPQGNRQRDGEGKIKSRDTDLDYLYSINWVKTGGGPPLTHDPKIAIKPETFSFLELLTYLLYALLAGWISFQTFWKKKIY